VDARDLAGETLQEQLELLLVVFAQVALGDVERDVSDDARDLLDGAAEDLQRSVALLLKLLCVHLDVADFTQAADRFDLQGGVDDQLDHQRDGVVHEDLADRDPSQEVCKGVQHRLNELHPEDARVAVLLVDDFAAQVLDLLELDHKLGFEVGERLLLHELLAEVEYLLGHGFEDEDAVFGEKQVAAHGEVADVGDHRGPGLVILQLDDLHEGCVEFSQHLLVLVVLDLVLALGLELLHHLLLDEGPVLFGQHEPLLLDLVLHGFEGHEVCVGVLRVVHQLEHKLYCVLPFREVVQDAVGPPDLFVVMCVVTKHYIYKIFK